MTTMTGGTKNKRSTGILFTLVTYIIFTLFVTTTVYESTADYAVYASSTRGDSSVFYARLNSGVYKDTGESTDLVIIVENLVKLFLSNVLPIVSIVSTTWILLSLIASLLYLIRPDKFDRIYIAKQNLKGKGLVSKLKNAFSAGGGEGKMGKPNFSNFFEGQGDCSFAETYLLPNVKAWAFYSATEASDMSVKDFLAQNWAKGVLVMSFTILIGNQTMLDMFYTFSEVGVYAISKITYDYDYVTIIDDLLTIGSNMPSPFSNTTQEGKNMTKVYDSVYKAAKEIADTEAEKSSEFKSVMGVKLSNLISGGTSTTTVDTSDGTETTTSTVSTGNIFTGVNWDATTFAVSVRRSSNVIQDMNSIAITAADLGYTGKSDVIYVTITSETSSSNTGYANTYNAESWSSGSFNLATANNLSDTSKLTITSATITYTYSDTIALATGVGWSNGLITWTAPKDAGTDLLGVRIDAVYSYNGGLAKNFFSVYSGDLTGTGSSTEATTE